MPARTRTRLAPVTDTHSSPAALAAAQAETPAATPATTRLIPVPLWGDYHDWPPQGGMRHLIFHAETNGFASAFKRVGRRVLVDEAAFFRCVEASNREAA